MFFQSWRMLFDSHVHFETDEGVNGLSMLVKRAREAGVERMIAVGGNHELNLMAVEGASSYPGRVYAAIGCDREQECGSCDPVHFSECLANFPNIVAIGEIGLDYYYHPEKPDAQLEIFGKMLSIARENMLPVIVHSRNAEAETLDLLGAHAKSWRGDADRIGVLHCFTASKEFAYKILDLGFYIGFSGIITFRNANDLRELAAEIPADRLLIETDTPYLAPEPERGKTNEPAFLVHIAQKLAEVRGMSKEEVAVLTCRNAERLFGI